MQQQFTNFKEFFRSIQILHIALVAGATLVMINLKFLVGMEDRSNGDIIFPALGISLAMGGLVIGHILYNKKIESIKLENLPVMERLAGFREAFIIKLAMQEGPALLCIILHFLDGNPLLFYTCLFMIAMLAFERPTKEKIMQQLGLSPEDIA